MKRRRVRHHYLLLEVVIAFALILLCFFPLVRSHTAVKTETLRSLEKVRLHREAQERFIDFKARLFEHDFTWETLRKEGRQGDFEIREIEYKTVPQANTNFMLIDICFYIGEKKSAPFRLFLERRPEVIG